MLELIGFVVFWGSLIGAAYYALKLAHQCWVSFRVRSLWKRNARQLRLTVRS